MTYYVSPATTPPESRSRVRMLQASPIKSLYDNEAKSQARIGDYIRILRPKIRDFLRTKPRLPTWIPELVDDDTRNSYSTLGVPCVDGIPSILLHDLGIAPNPNADNLFQGQR